MEMQYSKMATRNKYNNSHSVTFFITFSILNFLSLVNTIDSAFTIKSDIGRKSLSSGEKTNFEEIGNPSELAWQAWLLVDNQGDNSKHNGGSFDSASILRRITPKSIFIAPPLPACAEGYQADTMNRCVKTVDINQEAHIDFLLQRLNAMYANFGVPLSNPDELSSSSSSSSSQSESSGSSGPLQVNIPLIIDPVRTEISKENSDDSLIKPSVLDIVKSTSDHNKDSEKFEDKVVTKPQSSSEGDETILSIYEGIKNESAGFEQLIPVMEFVEDVNSNLSDIVDYKTSITIEQINKTVYNKTITTDEYNDNEENEKIAIDESNKKLLNSSSVESPQPTLFLILSPTNSPMINITADIKINNNITFKKIPINVTTNGDNSNNHNVIRINPPTVSIIQKATTIPGSTMLNTGTFDENTKADIGYDNDDNDDDHDEVKNEGKQMFESQTQNFEESTEYEDEILSHSEAGSMVQFSPTKFTQISRGSGEEEKMDGEATTIDVTTIDNLDTDMSATDNYKQLAKKNDQSVDAVRRDDKETNSTVKEAESNDADFDESEKLSTLFDESTETTDDLTTLPTTTVKEFATQQLKASGSDQTIVTIPKSSITFPQDEPKKIETIKPEVTSITSTPYAESLVSSTNDPEKFESHKLVFFVEKKDGDVKIDEKPTFGETNSAANVKFPTSTDGQSKTYNYYPLPFDNNRKSVLGKNEKLRISNPPTAGKFESEPYNFESTFHPINDQDYLKFPIIDRQHDQPNYVRFPSEQVNSIHTPHDFNDKYYYRQYSAQSNFQPMPLKSGIESHKPANKQLQYRHIQPENRRVNRQEPLGTLIMDQNDKKKADRSRTVLQFWSRMPLLQDTTTKQQQQQHQQQQQQQQYLLPKNTQNIYSDQQRISRRPSSRSIHFYNQISPINVTRSYARSLP